MRLLRSSLGLLLLLAAGAARAGDPWSRLAIGMSAEETLSALGEPLLKNVGKGFEIWIYDNHAEVLFFGNVIGWSTPGTGPLAKRTADVWQANGGKNDFRTVLAMLPPPKPKPTPRDLILRKKAPEWRPALRWMR